MRFTIRDLIWLTVVVAISCEWLIDKRHAAKQSRDRYIKVLETMMELQKKLLGAAVGAEDLAEKIGGRVQTDEDGSTWRLGPKGEYHELSRPDQIVAPQN